MRSDKRGWVGIISLIASIIAIFVFLTGWENVLDVFSGASGLLTGPTPLPQDQLPTSEPIVVSPILTYGPDSTSTLPTSSWTNLGLNAEPISDISTSQGVIYVATFGAGHGIFKSEDLGTTWYAINNGLESLDIILIEASPNNSDLLYSASNSGGIWRSEDGGATWVNVNPKEYCGTPIGLALGSEDGNTIYWLSCNGDFSVSTNKGKDWKESYCWPTCTLGLLRNSPADRSHFYSFRKEYRFSLTDPNTDSLLLRFSPEDDKWYPLADVGSGLLIVELDVSYQDPRFLLVATEENGIYRSQDGGGSWSPINNSLPGQGNELICTDAKFSPWDSASIFAVCNGQAYQSKDLGANWSLLPGLTDISILAMMTGPEYLLAAAATSLHGLETP